MLALEGRPRRVDDEGRQAEKDQQRLNPPQVAARRLAERPQRQRHLSLGHEVPPIHNPAEGGPIGLAAFQAGRLCEPLLGVPLDRNVDE